MDVPRFLHGAVAEVDGEMAGEGFTEEELSGFI
jgi:hypothetical protein